MANYGENEAQGKFWNDAPGQSWVKHDDVMNLRLGNISDILFDRLRGTSGYNVLDIGCGTGSTSIRLAETLTRDTRITGIDISEPMLIKAREKAIEHVNVAFVAADAQAFHFEPDTFDAAISRFGLMFFQDPPKAFTNFRLAMKTGSKLTFVCWASYEENEFFSVPLKTVLDFVPSEYELHANAPGPLAFSDKSYLLGILQSSEFSNSHIEVVKSITGATYWGQAFTEPPEYFTNDLEKRVNPNSIGGYVLLLTNAKIFTLQLFEGTSVAWRDLDEEVITDFGREDRYMGMWEACEHILYKECPDLGNIWKMSLCCKRTGRFCYARTKKDLVKLINGEFYRGIKKLGDIGPFPSYGKTYSESVFYS